MRIADRKVESTCCEENWRKRMLSYKNV